MRCIMYG